MLEPKHELGIFVFIMKELRIQIKDNKYEFILELLGNLDFVSVSDDNDELVRNLEDGFEEMQRYKLGRKKGTPLNDFLNEV